MSQRWLKFLERLGAPMSSGSKLTEPFDPRTIREGAWYEFRNHEALFRLYGPPPASPWFPYHCPTIFAGIDRLMIVPWLIETAEEITGPRPDAAWRWLEPGTMVLLDLPGGQSVQMGARLLVEAGAQLVSTFDHWPAATPMTTGLLPTLGPGGLENAAPKPWPPADVLKTVAIDSRDVIDSMVTMAPVVFQRIKQGIPPTAPPVWMCDSRRLTALEPGPGDFDNRYFIDDSILPSVEMLRNRGIERVVYFSTSPVGLPSDDLCGILNECHRAGMRLMKAAVDEPETWVEPITTGPPPEAKLAGRKFPKSQIGGFGRSIPVPEESSGYSTGRSYGGGGG